MKQAMFLVFLSIPIVVFAQNFPQQAISEIEGLIYRYAAENDIPTINLGLVHGGRIHFISHGVDNRTDGNNTSENSIFQIASVGKVLTGIVVNDLIQNGRLGIDRSILTYLPNTYSKQVKSKLEKITVRDLLNHRSGLPRQSKIIKRKNDEPIIYDYLSSDFERDFKTMKFEEYGVFNYSNFGYAVLAFMAERVTGLTFEELLINLAKDYGMQSTSVSCKNSQLLATPYDEDNRKQATKNWDMGKLAPPSGVYSSVSDMTNLLSAQLAVYKADDQEDILFLTNETRGAWNGTGISYGYGLFDWGNGEFGHGGGMDGYGSEYWFNPKGNVGFVLLTSSGGKWVTEISKEINKVLSNMNQK